MAEMASERRNDDDNDESDVEIWNVTKNLVLVEALPINVVSVVFAVLMSIIIIATVIGNVLVILSVFTYRPLRHVQNFYLVSLAVADLTVALLVMPYNVVYSMLGYWPFGGPFCLAWATCDILTCTASILHLCAIALDRYRAIHDPISYAQKRTIRRVLFCVLVVWFVSGLISIPPLLGWNDSSLFNETTRQCQLTNDPGFVLYSASGSFYIPLVVMIVVYIKIYLAVRVRLRARAAGGLAMVTGTTLGMTNVALATASTGKRAKPAATRTKPETVCSNDDNDQTELVGKRQTRSKTELTRTKPETVRLDADNEEIELGELRKGDVLRPDNEDDVDDDEQRNRRTSEQDDGDSPSRQSLVNGLSPRRFRQLIAHSSRRYGSRSRLADDPAVRGSHLTQFLAEKERISLSRERRAARTMAVVMGAFVLCWLPFFLMYVIMSFCTSCSDDTDPRVVNFIVWLGYVNSSLNPLIYTVFNVDFRHAFTALLQPNCHPSAL